MLPGKVTFKQTEEMREASHALATCVLGRGVRGAKAGRSEEASTAGAHGVEWTVGVAGLGKGPWGRSCRAVRPDAGFGFPREQKEITTGMFCKIHSDCGVQRRPEVSRADVGRPLETWTVTDDVLNQSVEILRMDRIGIYFEELPIKCADGLNAVQKRSKACTESVVLSNVKDEILSSYSDLPRRPPTVDPMFPVGSGALV